MTLSVNVPDKELKRLAKYFSEDTKVTVEDVAKAMTQYLEECAEGSITSTPEDMLDCYL